MENRTNGKAIASIIVAVLSVLCCCMWIVSLILAVVAVVLGILALRGENKNQEDAAIAGIIVGAVGFTLALTVAVMYILMFANVAEKQFVLAML